VRDSHRRHAPDRTFENTVGLDEAWFCIAFETTTSPSTIPPARFSLYIGSALVQFVTVTTFTHCRHQVVAAILLFPVVYLLARTLRFEFWTALLAQCCSAFSERLFLGGTAFSDIPSLTVLLGAIALSCVKCRAYFWGSLLLQSRSASAAERSDRGVSVDFASIAKISRASADPLFSAALMATIWLRPLRGGVRHRLPELLRVLREHSDYVFNVDGYRNPVRPSTLHLFWVFSPNHSEGDSHCVPALTVIGLFDDWRRSIRVLLIFAPLYVVGCFLFIPTASVAMRLRTSHDGASGGLRCPLVAAIISRTRDRASPGPDRGRDHRRFAMWTLRRCAKCARTTRRRCRRCVGSCRCGATQSMI